jgi:hypothetical protein
VSDHLITLVRQCRGVMRSSEKLVLMTIASYADPDGRGAFPAQQTIADDCGLSKRAVIKILHRLEEKQLLVIAEPSTGTRSTRYYIPPDALRQGEQRLRNNPHTPPPTGELRSPVSRSSGERSAPVRQRTGELRAPFVRRTGEAGSPPAPDVAISDGEPGDSPGVNRTTSRGDPGSPDLSVPIRTSQYKPASPAITDSHEEELNSLPGSGGFPN